MTFREWWVGLSADEKPMVTDEDKYNAGMKAGILKERARCADGCEMLARMGGTARECSEAIRKGE